LPVGPGEELQRLLPELSGAEGRDAGAAPEPAAAVRRDGACHTARPRSARHSDRGTIVTPNRFIVSRLRETINQDGNTHDYRTCCPTDAWSAAALPAAPARRLDAAPSAAVQLLDPHARHSDRLRRPRAVVLL